MSELRVSSIKNLAGEDLISKASLGLDQVDNTSDVAKPISAATQAAIDALPTVPSGGFTRQVLSKGSPSDYDTVWVDAPYRVNQRGVSTSDTSRLLSRSGNTPADATDVINIGSATSALLVVRVLGKSSLGITRSLILNFVVKDMLIVDSSVSYAYGGAGSETWTVNLLWNAPLGAYVLEVTGAASQTITWEASVEVVVV